MNLIRTRSNAPIPSTWRASGLAVVTGPLESMINMNLNTVSSMAVLSIASYALVNGTLYKGPLSALFLSIEANEGRLNPTTLIRENVISIELQAEAMLVTTDLGSITFDLSDCQYTTKDKDAMARILPCLRAMNSDGAIRLRWHTMECDICSMTGAGTITPAREFSDAVQKGFRDRKDIS